MDILYILDMFTPVMNLVSVIVAIIALFVAIIVSFKSVEFGEKSMTFIEGFGEQTMNEAKKFSKDLIFNQNRPYLMIGISNLDTPVMRKNIFDTNNGINIGYDYFTGDEIAQMYFHDVVSNNDIYLMTLHNYGVHSAMNITLSWRIEFRNNVVEKIQNKIKLIDEDVLSTQDIISFEEVEIGVYTIATSNYSNNLTLYGSVEGLKDLSQNEFLQFKKPYDYVIIQQFLLSLDLATDQTDAKSLVTSSKPKYSMTHYLDDMFLILDISYADPMNNVFYDTIEVSTFHSYRGHGVESGIRSSDGKYSQTIYPLKVKQEVIVNEKLR